MKKSTFLSCSRLLQSIIIPENITRIRWTAFYECKSLESFTIPETVRCIDYGAFAKCEKLRISVAPNHPYFTADDDVLFDKKQERLIMYEQGLTSPSLETAQKLCKALGVSMDDVFGE